MKALYACVGVALAGLLAITSVHGQTAGEKLIVYGDVVYFMGVGKPRNCTATSQFKHGEPIGFRMTALDPVTRARDRATQLTVHLTYGGKTIDLPMADHEAPQRPEADFWVAKWIVPDDAPVGTVSYSVTARDPKGRTGEFKPFAVQASQLTIVQ